MNDPPRDCVRIVQGKFDEYAHGWTVFDAFITGENSPPAPALNCADRKLVACAENTSKTGLNCLVVNDFGR